jgi:aminopeptidase N
MYRFIPWLSRLIPFGRQPHGEPFVTGVSPRVRVALSSDRDVVWATSGQRVSRDGRTSVFEARDVRDFAVAASPAYRTRSGRSLDGQTRITVHASRGDRGRLLRLAQEELQRYERITGVAYPYPTFRIAQTSSGLPMEAPAMIWIPAGRSAVEWPFLVSHETAHQWFYAIVGNDQASDAFADEAMADYFSRRAHLWLRPSRCPLDRLDRDIRGYSTTCYYETIYVQGARFLAGLRRDFGAGAFRRAVRAYAHDYRMGMGSNARLLEAFRDQMGNGVLERYRARFPSIY